MTYCAVGGSRGGGRSPICGVRWPVPIWYRGIVRGQLLSFIIVHRTQRNATPIMWKWILRIVIAIAVLVLALKIADRLARRGSPLPAIPQANGCDTLLTVAHKASAPQGDLADLGAEASGSSVKRTEKIWEGCTRH